MADKRYAARAAAPAKPAPRPRKAPKPRRPRRGGISGFILGVVGFFWRLIWKVTFAVTTVVMIGLGGWVFSIYSTLPPVDDLLDGRARGSVTLIDVNERTFAYRGETYGITSANSVAPVLHDAVVATE
ncbi:MAG: glycosyl transferase, partial [Paracoccaceae bacterium]